MQVELFLDESCLNSCESLMIEKKTNFASYCFKEIDYNMKVRVSTILETPGTNKLQSTSTQKSWYHVLQL